MNEKLQSFADHQPGDDLHLILASHLINRVEFYVLGPEGTNIARASRAWSQEHGLATKSNFHLCETPEVALLEANKITEKGVFPLFTTCAVYFRLAEMFFTNPVDTVLLKAFFFPLDNMQLAAREAPLNGEIPSEWKIASHSSPQYLLKALENEIVAANSNAAAAKMCATGQVDACITTEAACRIYGLKTLHSFGSPPMLFIFGTTPHGRTLIEEVRTANLMASATNNAELFKQSRLHVVKAS